MIDKILLYSYQESGKKLGDINEKEQSKEVIPKLKQFFTELQLVLIAGYISTTETSTPEELTGLIKWLSKIAYYAVKNRNYDIDYNTRTLDNTLIEAFNIRMAPDFIIVNPQ